MSNVSLIDGHIDEPKGLSDEQIIHIFSDMVYFKTHYKGDDLCHILSELDTAILKDTLDLINRLKADKEALINGQETLQKHLAEKNAEIEILIRKKESLRDEICELQSEIERLKEFEYMYNSLLK